MKQEYDPKQLTSFHKKRYGAWAGMPNGNRPDPKRCVAEVRSDSRSPISSQCGRTRGYGPEAAYCKQHDPAAVEERERRAKERWEAGNREFKIKIHAGQMLRALKAIADGHNDPRSFATEQLKEMGLWKGEEK